MAPSTTTRTSTRGKTAPAPILSQKGALRGLDEATAAAKKAAKDKSSDLTAAYVTTLKEAGGFHRKAFYVEVAVCLAFYAAQAKVTEKGENPKVDVAVKKALRPIYQKAGYDCKDAKGDDYKTVQRRISVAADLYAHLGGKDTIIDWAGDAKPVDAIHHVADQLEKQKYSSIDIIVKKVGRVPAARKTVAKATAAQAAPVAGPAATTVVAPAPEGVKPPDEADKELMGEVAAAAAARQQEGGQPAVTGGRREFDTLPPERVLRTEHLFLAIPAETTREELMKLATDILAFASTLVPVAPAAATA